jgi:hypothetical protein
LLTVVIYAIVKLNLLLIKFSFFTSAFDNQCLKSLSNSDHSRVTRVRVLNWYLKTHHQTIIVELSIAPVNCLFLVQQH